jgi:glycosyltransferase involved in cell wall biosynthesis
MKTNGSSVHGLPDEGLENSSSVAAMGNRSPTVFVGIPAFNVERTIAKVIVQAKAACDQVVVCDDGSSDDTRRIAEALGCKVVGHQRNLGYGAALRTLIDVAKKGGADVLVTIDGDGQHNPKEISALVDPIIQKQADLVIGTRFGENGLGGEVPRLRKFGIKSITWLVDRLSGQKISDAQSGFRAYSRRALSCVRPGELGMGASTEILLSAKSNNLKVVEVSTMVTYNEDGNSTHNPILHFADVIASTLKVASIRHPLRFFGIPGIIFLVTSLYFALWAMNIFSQEHRLVTNLALISIGSAIIGTFLTATGVILFTLITVIREHSPV